MKKIENYKTVKNYFANKAELYDLTDTQTYWGLSDELLWDSLKKVFVNKIMSDDKIKILDAGGGTGRWALKIAKSIKGTVYLVDLSPEMLSVAKKKMQAENITNVKIIESNLEDLSSIFENDFFDYTISLHNVLGFVKSPSQAFKVLSNITRKGICLFVPNLFHMIFFNVSVRRELEDANATSDTKKGRFTKDMPSMHAFTPSRLEQLYDQNGFDLKVLSGFPKFIYPGFQETQLEGFSKDLQSYLKEGSVFEDIKNLETQWLFDKDSASRGNLLFSYGEKHEISND